MDKFKPCPFCGSLNLNAGDHFIICFTCHSAGPFANSKEEAVLLWNHAPRVGDNNCDYLNFTGGCNTFTIY